MLLYHVFLNLSNDVPLVFFSFWSLSSSVSSFVSLFLRRSPGFVTLHTLVFSFTQPSNIPLRVSSFLFVIPV